VVDGADNELEEIWDADLGLTLKSGSASDFGRALANVDVILSAVAIGAADPYWVARTSLGSLVFGGSSSRQHELVEIVHV
jgi:hypothetical protein